MRVIYSTLARGQLGTFPLLVQRRIMDKVDFYAAQSDPLKFAKPLTGYGAFRFRIGNYRAIFDISHNCIEILLVVKREGAYRDL